MAGSLLLGLSGLWVLLLFVGAFGALIVAIRSAHSGRREIADANYDLKFESDLQVEISRTRRDQVRSTWTAPKLPSSVIAAIWTDRFIGKSTQSTKMQRLASKLGGGWDYSREAPYIVATALLSLRDGGLIRMALAPGGRFLDSMSRVWVERTEVALPNFEVSAVELGLLLAINDIAQKWFGKTNQPSIQSLIREWIGPNDHPYRWVLAVAMRQGMELGLCEPVIKKRGRFGKWFDEKPTYSMEHLAACEDQVFACAARWQEFCVSEPELQDRLLTEVSFAINSSRPASGG
jgi:hypothetical protein